MSENIPQDPLTDLLKSWEVDAVIDSGEPGRELIRIPILHSKYLNILVKYKMRVKKNNIEYSKMKKLKWMYFNGKMSKEELDEQGWEQFGYVLKTDLPVHLEADKDLIAIQEKKFYNEEIVSACEAILGELKQRTWQLRDYISYEKFINGQ